MADRPAPEAGIRAGVDEEGYVVVIVTDKGGAGDGHESLDLRIDPGPARDLAFELLSRAEEASRHPRHGWTRPPEETGTEGAS